MKILAPSILSADFSNLSQQIRCVEIGGADWIHCDVMDGHFVPNITFGPLVIKSVKKITRLPLDVHLMIANPDNYLDDFVKAGANYITVHQEAVSDLNKTTKKIKDLGIKAGVSVSPSTPLSKLKNILPITDLVLIMSVNPGFGGQGFISSSLIKIKELAQMRESNNYNFLIEVDGGINSENIKTISEAGCDVCVVGASIFNSNNITAATVELNNILKEKKN